VLVDRDLRKPSDAVGPLAPRAGVQTVLLLIDASLNRPATFTFS